MMRVKTKSFLMQFGILYFVGFIIVFGIKYFYSKAGSDELEWILAPTTWWIRILSGITFEKESHVGYINHYFRFIIAPSCSGVQFMLIAIVTLLYSFVHRMGTRAKGFCWMVLSLGFSYMFTIFVNGFRIILSIYLPFYFHKQGIYSRLMTPERLHTIIGTVVYFAALCALYHMADYTSQKMARLPKGSLQYIHNKYPSKPFFRMICKCIPPMFWYFSIAIGIPLLNMAYKNDSEKFMEYGVLLTAVCLVIILLVSLVLIIKDRFCSRKKVCHNPSCCELK